MFVKVVVKSFMLSRAENIFTYSVPLELKESIEVGKRVVVPFGKGNKLTIGLIIGIEEKTDLNNLKEVFDILDEEKIVNESQIELAKFLSDRYITNLTYCLNSILPPGDWSKIDEYFALNLKNNFKDFLEDKEIEFFSKSRNILEINEFGINHLKIKELLENCILEKRYRLNRVGKSLYSDFYKLKEEADISKIRKNAKKQLELMDFLKNRDFTEIAILRDNGFSSQTLKSLLEMDFLEKKTMGVSNKLKRDLKKYDKLKLNLEQQEAFDKIINSEKLKFLLHGVTGSGKTEIYLQLVEKMLSKGKSSIILVPEISLTPQTIERFSGRFGEEIAIIHSKLTATEKLQQWKLIQSGRVRIVVGARSAIFSPIKNLGLIIIDEEHESSYISDQAPRYYTHEVAEYLCEQNSAKLILGSATPSVNIYNFANKGVYELLELKNRATKNMLPEVKIVDMRAELLTGNRNILSNELYEEIYECLERKEQVVLFLNKRGRSSFVFCRSCGYVLKCDYCDISMTYHKDSTKDVCICHLCGRVKQKPKICPHCYKKSIKEFGFGTEALEEHIKNAFPNARVHRIDGDTSKEKNAYDDLYRKMKSGEIDILIGTQMISKGLDFPNVTLVGVVLADISLNISSFYSAEKTFQLITQVAGRSGRGEKKGKVIIQTYKPSHYSILNSSSHNYEQFFEDEKKFRKTFIYPPFTDIVNFQFRSKDIDNCISELKKIKDEILKKYGEKLGTEIILLGPNPDSIKWVNRVYRYNLTVKVLENFDEFRKFLNELIKNKNFSFNTEKNGKLILTIN